MKKEKSNDHYEILGNNTRIFVEKTAEFIGYFFSLTRNMMDAFVPLVRKQIKKETKTVRLGSYSPIGFFFIFLSVYYFIRLNNLFSPPYVVYFFIIVALAGFRFLKTK